MCDGVQMGYITIWAQWAETALHTSKRLAGASPNRIRTDAVWASALSARQYQYQYQVMCLCFCEGLRRRRPP